MKNVKRKDLNVDEISDVEKRDEDFIWYNARSSNFNRHIAHFHSFIWCYSYWLLDIIYICSVVILVSDTVKCL